MNKAEPLPLKEHPKPPQFKRFEDAMRRIVKVSKDEIVAKDKTTKTGKVNRQKQSVKA